jgi:3-oxoacyl-[acyl-carrier protein] reductase
VTVNTVSPGIVVTPGTQAFFRHVANERGWQADDWPAVEKKVVEEFASNTVGRLGTVEEVGQFFAYLASPLSGFINGSNLRIDGGFVDAVM